MRPAHTVILKAKRSEFEALINLDRETSAKIEPLFDVGRLPVEIRRPKYLQNSDTPTAVFLNRVLDGIADAWRSRPAMIDAYHWPADFRVEKI